MSGQAPTDIANQALDAAGVDFTLGDITEGTRPAQVILRAYGQCLRQLLRTAHWAFARKTAPLVLLADATAQTANVGTLVPVPWIYEYAYPTDCVKARFIPWNQSAQNPAVPPGNIEPPDPSAPLMTGLGQAPLTGQRIIPARWCEATDYNNLPPAPIGTETQGLSPVGQTVILTNVQNAQLVYTCLTLYPTLWDALFRAAFVAYLASEIALPLAKDKKFALTLREMNIKIAKDKIRQARATDGNEGFYSSTLSVDWMRVRNSGGSNVWWGNGFNDGPGILWGGYDSMSFGDGSAY